MALRDFLLGTKPELQQLQRFNPNQQQGINQSLQYGLQGIQPENFGANFAPIAQNARNQFAQSTVPTLAERFTALGGQRSSAFPQALGQAGANLESSLAGQQSQFGLQDRSQLMQLLGLGLTPQFDYTYQQGSPGLFSGLAGGLGQGIGGLGLFGLLRLLGGL